MYVTFVASTDGESCTRPISTNPGSMEAGEYGLTRGAKHVFRRTSSRGGRDRRAAVDFRGVFGCGGISGGVSDFSSSNAHGLLQV